MEVGSIILYPADSVPDGYLVCNGAAVPRDTYSALFEVIGTTYGAGDGISTFNLPDFSGNSCVGVSQTYQIGSSGGEAEHTLLTSEIAGHSHDIPSHTHTVTGAFKTPEFSHSITQPNFTYTRLNGTAVRGSAGIKNQSIYNGRSTQTMSRSTNLAIADHAAADCTMSGGIADYPAFDTESTGQGTGHNNMMPYLALTYLIYSQETVYPPGMVYFNGAMVAGPSGCYFTGKG